jgi:chemotaxis protein histidine kinase CheA
MSTDVEHIFIEAKTAFNKEARRFLAETTDEISTIEEHPERATKFATYMHTMRGGAGFLGLPAIAEKASAAEKLLLAVAGADYGASRQKVALVKVELEELEKLLNELSQGLK